MVKSFCDSEVQCYQLVTELKHLDFNKYLAYNS